MPNLRTEDRQALLKGLSQMGSQGRAEGEDEQRLSRTFYPVKEHLRMLDPNVVLVVGPRGSGKTEIFRVLTDANLMEAVSTGAAVPRLPSAGGMTWCKGFPLGREGFDATGLRRFVDAPENDADVVQKLWFAYLVRTLRNELDIKSRGLKVLIEAHGGAVSDGVRAMHRQARPCSKRTYDRLGVQRRVAYDGEDRADEVLQVAEGKGRIDAQVERAVGWVQGLGKFERDEELVWTDEPLLPPPRPCGKRS